MPIISRGRRGPKATWRRRIPAKTVIHVNRHEIRNNQYREHPEPVISVKRNNNNIYGHSVKINGPCEIVYQPDRPLNCGAVLWIATYSTVEVKRKRFEEIVEKGCNKYKEIKDMFVVSAS